MQKLLCVVACLAMVAAAQATVIVESRTSTGALTATATYAESPASWPTNLSNSTAKSTAAGLVGVGSRYSSNAAVNGTCWFEMKPVLPVATEGNEWDVYVTVPGGAGIADPTTPSVAITGATADFTKVNLGTAAVNTWLKVGTITLNAGVTQPTIKVIEDSNAYRFYADAMKFEAVPEPATLLILALGGLFLRRRVA